MKTAKEYMYDEYGNKHISHIMEIKDVVSILAIMQEYANYCAKECLSIAANKYEGMTMKDGFGSVCDVQSAITSVKIYLPEL